MLWFQVEFNFGFQGEVRKNRTCFLEGLRKIQMHVYQNQQKLEKLEGISEKLLWMLISCA